MKKYRKRMHVVIKAAAAAFCLSACMASAAYAAPEKTVHKGVLVDGMDVSGMTEKEVTAAINEHVKALGETAITIHVGENELTTTFNEMGLTWVNTDIVSQMMKLGTSGTIVQRYKDQKDLAQAKKEYTLQYSADEETVRAYVDGCTMFDTVPVNAQMYVDYYSMTPAVQPGVEGSSLDVETSVTMLTDAVSGWDGTTEVDLVFPVDTVMPDITYADLVVLTDQLGTATTYYGSSYTGRGMNVENGCRLINEHIVLPGEEFSVEHTLEPFTAENGYEKAASYEEDRVVDTYGGGICQVSTTLYNAVLQAELEVTRRSCHTMTVHYVPLSMDAAIAEQLMDFRFVNNLNDPIFIIGYCYGGYITFSIYGRETRPANRYFTFSTETVQTIPPDEGVSLFANPEKAAGFYQMNQSPQEGYSTILWKYVYVDGVLVDTIQVNSSYYYPVGTVYEVGTMTDNVYLAQSLYNAIAANSLAQVQQLVGAGG